MSYADDLNYQTLLLLAAAHNPDPKAADAAYEAAWDSQVDPIHIAMNFAVMMKQWLPLEAVEQQLAIAAAAAAANFPDQGELKHPSPRGKIQKPGRGMLWIPPEPDQP